MSAKSMLDNRGEDAEPAEFRRMVAAVPRHGRLRTASIAASLLAVLILGLLIGGLADARKRSARVAKSVRIVERSFRLTRRGREAASDRPLPGPPEAAGRGHERATRRRARTGRGPTRTPTSASACSTAGTSPRSCSIPTTAAPRRARSRCRSPAARRLEACHAPAHHQVRETRADPHRDCQMPGAPPPVRRRLPAQRLRLARRQLRDRLAGGLRQGLDGERPRLRRFGGKITAIAYCTRSKRPLLTAVGATTNVRPRGRRRHHPGLPAAARA